jgi:hypothetical protein
MLVTPSDRTLGLENVEVVVQFLLRTAPETPAQT